MSWNGFKKAINRAGAQVMMKTGQIEESVDKEYEFEEKRFRAMETSSSKLHKELRHYMDSLRILTSAQVNVSEVLSSFYGDQGEEQKQEKDVAKNKHLSQEYHLMMKKLNDETLGELEAPYNQTVLNPVAKFNSYFIDINDAIKKRNHKKLDYDAMKSKVRKLMEKPTTDAHYESKLSQSQNRLAEAEAAYEGINLQLKEDLPRLLDLRIPFLDPSFEAFVKIQLRFFSENFVHLNEFQRNLDARTREDYITGNLDEKIDEALRQMKNLNIMNS